MVGQLPLMANEDTLQKASQAMVSGNYQQALVLFTQIDSLHGGNQALYANMAMASAALGLQGKTNLYFRKAQKLCASSPEMEKLAEQLNQDSILLQTQTSVSPLLSLINRSTEVFLPNTWAWASLILTGLLLLILGWAYKLHGRWFHSTLGLQGFAVWGLLLATLFSFFAAGYRHTQVFHNKGMVIMAPSSVLRVGPDSESPVILPLKEGTYVRRSDQIGEWIEVETLDGDQGWVMVKEAAKI